jgi:tetratricopeptide (TPR) repeat protein
MKRLAYWALPLLLISALTTQALAEAEQAQAQPSIESPKGTTTKQSEELQLHETTCLMLLNQQKYTESIAECQEALKLNPKDGFAWYWIGLSHRAALLDLAKKYNIAVNNYNSNRSGPIPPRDNLRAAMQEAQKLAEDKRNETVDAFTRAAAIGGGAGQPAREELQKIFEGTPQGTPEQIQLLIDQKKSQLRD